MKHLPPHLQRRSFLKLGIGAAVVLAVAGGAVALIKPGLVNGRLSPSARLLMARVGQAMLQGTLPADALEQQRAIDAVLQRTDDFTAGLPAHVQAELSQLFGLLATAAGPARHCGSVAVVGRRHSGRNQRRTAVHARVRHGAAHPGLPGTARHRVCALFLGRRVLEDHRLSRPQSRLSHPASTEIA